MASYKDYFPRDKFSAAELEAGLPPPLTITGIAPEKMPGGDMKPVVSFKEDKRKLVLNSTNAKMLEMLTGSCDPADAVGFRVQLTLEDTLFGGKPTKGIRLRRPSPPAAVGSTNTRTKAAPAKPASATRTSNDLPDDEIPY